MEKKIDSLLGVRGQRKSSIKSDTQILKPQIKFRDRSSQTAGSILESPSTSKSETPKLLTPTKPEILLRKPHSPKSIAQVVQLFTKQLVIDEEQSKDEFPEDREAGGAPARSS